MKIIAMSFVLLISIPAFAEVESKCGKVSEVDVSNAYTSVKVNLDKEFSGSDSFYLGGNADKETRTFQLQLAREALTHNLTICFKKIDHEVVGVSIKRP